MKGASAAALAAKVPEPPPHKPWEWSIAEAWTWLVEAWRAVSHMPYLGLLSLILAGLLVLMVLARLLGSR
jgi:hypothetical protein